MRSRRRSVAQFLIAIGLLVTTGNAFAENVAFTKIVDTTDTMPGGGGTFAFAFDPAISGDLVAFFGSNSNFSQNGIYTGNGSVLSVVANKSTAVPGGIGNYSVLQCPTLSGTTVYFNGRDSNVATGGSEGLFCRTGAGAISVIANHNTAIPSSSGLFTDVGFCITTDGTSVAFRGARVPDFGNANDRREGIYSNFGGLHRVADKTTAVPGGSGTFNGEPSGIGNFSNPVASGNDLVFRAVGTSSQEGIYHYNATTHALSAVADKTDNIPESVGLTFNRFGITYDYENDYVAFIAQNETGGFPNTMNQAGIYLARISTGNLTKIADLNTIVPGSVQTFGENGPLSSNPFSAVAISNGNILFAAAENAPTSSAALFYWKTSSGELSRLLGLGDDLDGKTVSGLSIRTQGGNAMDGNKFAVALSFSDGSSAIYRGEIEPPSCEPDNNDPSIQCPGPLFDATNPGDCVATVLDLGMPVVDDFCGIDTVTNDAPEDFPVGETTVTWTVTDTSGRTASCEQTVTISDAEAPTIDCPPDIEVATAPGECSVTGLNLGEADRNDNCPGASASNDAPDSFPIGETTVTWTATDAAGNMATCTQAVTVLDEESPTIACPANINTTTDAGECFATNVDLGQPVANDNCNGVTVGNDAPATFPLGDTTITWTATDDSGNMQTCEQTVTVTDSQSPSIDTCPANQTIDASANCEATVPNLVAEAAASDACDASPAITQNPAAGSTIGLGEKQITMTATDNAGNSSTCTVTLTVVENGCNDPEPNPGPGEDGVDDATEDGAPNNGDGNNDGTPDRQQDNVTSLPNADGNYLTIVSPAGTTLANVSTSGNPSPGDAPEGVSFPVGFVSFEVRGLAPGASAQVQIIADLPAGTVIDTNWKYGPEPGNPTPHWYEFLSDGTTGAVVAGNVVTLNFVDGGRGDDDLNANGVIVDPSAPATAPQVTPPQETPDCGTGLCGTGTAMFTPMMLLSLSLARRRNRRR